ncbi:hypothetical protein EV207_1519 [Scopulibacillus darangshiensis]|uniref:Uncharacterized protein n=1 Tax=Scopulibacillus darangshiensis TaxID=442528 RepID=A0A4R2NGY7_9BACL|nr:hypothetical protein [Scopulibacillus darangshiensis]TCP20643.1 hypothetical protein EV207_1519 [Scopulibacillus darangshiensis]
MFKKLLKQVKQTLSESDNHYRRHSGSDGYHRHGRPRHHYSSDSDGYHGHGKHGHSHYGSSHYKRRKYGSGSSS